MFHNDSAVQGVFGRGAVASLILTAKPPWCLRNKRRNLVFTFRETPPSEEGSGKPQLGNLSEGYAGVWRITVLGNLKNNYMKRILRSIAGAATLFSLAAVITSAPPAYGQDTAKGGGGKLMTAPAFKSTTDLQKLKPGDLVVETCPNCKMTTYTRIDDSAKGGGLAKIQTDRKCPACGADMKSASAKHTCKMCGAEMICCVIPGTSSSGDMPMHEHDANK